MHHTKLSRVLDLIINEEKEAAVDLLHSILVDKSRAIYEEVMCDEFDEESDEEVCEAFGDESEKEGFASDISDDNDEIDADEEDDMGDVDYDVDAADGDFEEGEEDLGDKVDSLTAQLDALQAAFDELLSQEAEEPNHDFSEIGDEHEGEESEVDEFDEAYIGEATKFSNEVAKPDNADRASNKTSPYTKAPSKQDFGGKPTKFAKGSGDGKQAEKTARKEKVEDNIDVPTKQQTVDMRGEGKLSAKGGSSGAVQGKSPLSKKPK